jgi:hypothetical protein
MTTHATTTLERAFEIVASGRCRTIIDLHQQLAREGFHDHVRALFGVSMRQQLQARMVRRKAAAAEPPQ